MKGPSLIVFLEAGGKRSVYIVSSGHRGDVLNKGLITIVVVEAGGRRAYTSSAIISNKCPSSPSITRLERSVIESGVVQEMHYLLAALFTSPSQ